MFETYFGLCRRPFAAVPRTDQYYAGESIETARQTLIRCIQRGEGVGIVVGPSGTGKSLLCQMLAEQFKSVHRVALICRNGMTSRRALIQAILYELGQPYRGMDEGELRLALMDYVSQAQKCPRGMLLMVDEAEHFSLRLFDEIRALTNLATDGQPRVRLVLAGGGALEERLANPKLESFSQRIVARCYLSTLNRAETESYVQRQVALAGGQASALFPAEACEAIYHATEGVPRLINQLCDHALLLAYAAGKRHIDPDCVEEAWADLQQLPTRFSDGGPPADSGIIEFGGLADDGGEADRLVPPSPAVEPDTVPMLRVTGDEETGTDALPLEHLRQIENTLAQLDDEFHPIAALGPEVELVFSDPSNPFSERFVEEEIIVDHRTGSGEAAGTPLENQSRSGSAAVKPEVTIVLRPPVGPDPRANKAASAMLRPDGPYSFAAPTFRSGAAGFARPGRLASASVVAIAAEGQPSLVVSDDSDMIILEEGYDDSSAPPDRPATPVRHLEYRRLFARLRHG